MPPFCLTGILVLVAIEQRLSSAFPSLSSPVFIISVFKLGCAVELANLVSRDHTASLCNSESSLPIMEESFCPQKEKDQ